MFIKYEPMIKPLKIPDMSSRKKPLSGRPKPEMKRHQTLQSALSEAKCLVPALAMLVEPRRLGILLIEG